MSDIKRGEIYWIDQNPYRNSIGSVQKPGRPAIIVSNDVGNRHSLTVEIVYLTREAKKDLPTHCTITSSNYVSTALCEQISTASVEQVREYIGKLTPEEMEEVERCMSVSLGLPIPQTDEEIIQEFKESGIVPFEPESDPLPGINELELRLAAANARVELLQSMYNDLLSKKLG